MSWEKLGRVYVAAGERPWARSHAMLPTSMMLDEERIRVYFAACDADGIGRITAVEVDARDPRRIVRPPGPEPLLDIGVAGTFDDHGVNPLWLLPHAGRLYLYYVGYQLGTRVRYQLFAGLAVSDDGGESFRRVSQVPLLDRRDGELFVRTATTVLHDGDRWRMWYVGGDSWVERADGKQVPRYSLRVPGIAGSDALGGRRARLHGARGGRRAWLRPALRRSRGRPLPHVVLDPHSQPGYRLGYAESPDGISWTRRDDLAGLQPSPTGWDSEMTCYGCLQPTRFGTYLFYNGNHYGETGFGVAVRRP